jgi:anti-anti-sigma factor
MVVYGQELRVEVDENVVRLVGELDMATAPLVKAGSPVADSSLVEIDLSDLTFLDVRGLDAIVAVAAELRGEGHEVEVRGAQGIIRRVFELTGEGGLLSDG